MESKWTITIWFQRFIMLFFILLFWGCAHHQPLPQEPYQLAYGFKGDAGDLLERWAPVFIVYGHSRTHNHIGRPRVELGGGGGERVFIDTGDPAVYAMKRPFKTEKGAYTNLIYRVHFPGTPFSLIPFNLTAGKNVGLMVVVTLNDQDLPVLVTTVHTCGCYKAIVPTQYLPRDALPDKWDGKRMRVYGETLPPLLNFDNIPTPRIMVHLRPGVHRVMDLGVGDTDTLARGKFHIVPMQMEPMERLLHLPVNGGTTSLYHGKGVLKGHVKGAVKPLETLFLSLISFDLFVGTDKPNCLPPAIKKHFF